MTATARSNAITVAGQKAHMSLRAYVEMGIGWGWLVWVYARGVLARLRIGRGAGKAHQGARALLAGEDALLVQPKLAVALGGINQALIVQKLYEWIDYNRAQNSTFHFQKGRWWTYNSYQEWKDKHFPWLSVSSVARMFRELERLGVVVSDQHLQRRGDQRKWYALDTAALYRLTMTPKWSHHRANLIGGDSKMESSSRQNGTMNQLEIFKEETPNQKFQSIALTLPTWKPTSQKQKALTEGQGQPTVELTENAGQAADVSAFDGDLGLAGVDPPPSSAPPPSHYAWEVAYRQLELQMDRGNWHTWLKHMQFVEVVDGVWVIGAPSVAAREMLAGRLHRSVRAVLAAALGEQDQEKVAIRFVDMSADAERRVG